MPSTFDIHAVVVEFTVLHELYRADRLCESDKTRYWNITIAAFESRQLSALLNLMDRVLFESGRAAR